MAILHLSLIITILIFNIKILLLFGRKYFPLPPFIVLMLFAQFSVKILILFYYFNYSII